mmetsp:Transcript_11157/g.18943  ORF Transcript_11157/g.18943 Transcript_11157/m.18943 type:complete len:108 (-) Transcript_11157:348-671(-)
MRCDSPATWSSHYSHSDVSVVVEAGILDDTRELCPGDIPYANVLAQIGRGSRDRAAHSASDELDMAHSVGDVGRVGEEAADACCAWEGPCASASLLDACTLDDDSPA